MTDFWRIYRLILTRRWMILGLVGIALVTVLVAKRVSEDQITYTAGAIVLPSSQAMNAGGLYKDNKTGVLSPTYDRNSRLSLFTQSIHSHTQDALDWATLPTVEQKRKMVLALSSQLNDESRKRATAPGATEDELDQVLNLFKVPTDPQIWAPRTVTPDMQKQVRDSLEASPVYDSSVNANPGGQTSTPTMTDFLQIQVHASNPLFAEQTANLLAAAFVNGYTESGKEEYQNSVAQFRQNQQQAKTALDQAQNALMSYEKQTGIVNLPVALNSAVTDLNDLKQKQETAQQQFSSASQTSAQLTQLLHATPPKIRTDFDPTTRPDAQKLATKISDDQAALQTLQARYTPNYPPLQHAQQALQAEQDEYKKLLAQPYFVERENPQYSNLKAESDNAKAQVASAQATLSVVNQQIHVLQASNSGTLPEAERRLTALQNARDTALSNKRAADAAYAGLAQANKELDNGLITLTNAATYATPDSTGPGLAALLVYATLLSLVLGVAVTLGIDALDNRIQTIGDAEKLLGMPISAVIPEMPPGDPKRLTRMIVADPLSPVAEAYRLLRTDLLFTAEDKPFKSLMGATAKPGQGATTTICNLAVALAQVGKRVILIDADLRRPKLHEFFGVSNETGLTSLLRSECEMEEALKLTDIDNLLLLPSGPLPLNPSELLASNRMRTLHERMKPHTDFILVDTPSAIAFSDSAILASFMDAVLLVMRAQEAPRGGEGRVRELLSKARANVVGVVLNGVKPQLVDSYHYHAAYYPQITTAPLLEAPHTANGHALPAPDDTLAGLPAPVIVEPAHNGNGNGNGYGPHAGNGYEPTLMGVRLDHRQLQLAKAAEEEAGAPRDEGSSLQTGEVAPPETPADDTTVIKQPVAAAPSKSRFNWRALFGTDDTE